MDSEPALYHNPAHIALPAPVMLPAHGGALFKGDKERGEALRGQLLGADGGGQAAGGKAAARTYLSWRGARLFHKVLRRSAKHNFTNE